MNNIKKYRLSINLTQVQLARRLGVTQSSVAMWETGKAMPRASMLVEMGKLFGVTIEQLLGEETGPEKGKEQAS